MKLSCSTGMRRNLAGQIVSSILRPPEFGLKQQSNKRVAKRGASAKDPINTRGNSLPVVRLSLDHVAAFAGRHVLHLHSWHLGKRNPSHTGKDRPPLRWHLVSVVQSGCFHHQMSCPISDSRTWSRGWIAATVAGVRKEEEMQSALWTTRHRYLLVTAHSANTAACLHEGAVFVHTEYFWKGRLWAASRAADVT